MILLFIKLVRKNYTHLDRLYIRFLYCTVFLLFTNALSWVFNGWPGWTGRGFALLFNLLLFVISYLQIGMFSNYYAGFMEERGADTRTTLRMVWLISGTGIVLSLISQWNQMFYFLDAQNVFQTGSLFWISQAIGIAAIAVDFVALLRWRSMLGIREFLVFFSYMVIPAVVLVGQIFFYGMLSLYFATTFVAVCTYIFIQSEQANKLVEKELELELEKSHAKLMEKELELQKSHTAIMLSQVQPHFLYNALVSIKNLCDTEPQTASDALEHFSYYLRGNLDSLSDTRLIYFDKELIHVKDYLYLEKLRFEEKLSIVWELRFTDFVLPSLTLQPLVENAVRHGITEKKGGGTLTIRSEKTSDGVLITITDDGVGFDVNKAKADGNTHIGIDNVRSRLRVQCGGALLIESERGIGTTVKIILPQKKEVQP